MDGSRFWGRDCTSGWVNLSKLKPGIWRLPRKGFGPEDHRSRCILDAPRGVRGDLYRDVWNMPGACPGNFGVRYAPAGEWEVILPAERVGPLRNLGFCPQAIASVAQLMARFSAEIGSDGLPGGESPVCSRGERVSCFGWSAGDRRCSGRENSGRLGHPVGEGLLSVWN